MQDSGVEDETVNGPLKRTPKKKNKDEEEKFRFMCRLTEDDKEDLKKFN